MRVRSCTYLFVMCGLLSLTTSAIGQPSPVPSEAIAISRHGLIAGYIWVGGAPSYPFLWDRGERINLDPQATHSWGTPFPMDVNDRGQVVASAQVGSSYGAFLLDHGKIVDLTPPEATIAIATAINNRGQVVGVWSSATVVEDAFLWEDGRWTDLGSCSSDGDWQVIPLHYGLTINERGDVIGLNGKSFLWSNGVRTELDFYANGINNRGQIVGSELRQSNFVIPGDHAYLWEDGRRTELAMLGSSATALAINDRGQIAGVSDGHAVRWERDGTLTDLGNPQGDAYLGIEGINSGGDVVGFDEINGWLWQDKGTAPIRIGPIYNNHGSRLEIDDRGEVAYNVVNGGAYDAFLWSRGEIIPIGVPFAASPSASGYRVDGELSSKTPLLAKLSLSCASPTSGPVALRYAVPNSGPVRLEVFNVRGVRVRLLVDQRLEAGTRETTWDGRDAAGRELCRGVYLARLQAGSEMVTTKIIRVP